jgi:N-formylglutamate deformylase
MTPVEVHPGDGPVVLGMPHVGTHLPDDLKPRLTETGLALGDTDWWVDRLYEGLLPDATVVKATHARYVIDLNRDPTGASLYPGQATTGLCPTTDFDGRPLYRDGADPDEDEIAARRRAVHTPYHDALAAALEAARTRHGVAVLYDCHSIRSRVPRLFDGNLPVFNIGTNDGATCAPVLRAAVADICTAADGYDHVVDGRFKGGWTTRRYGRPAAGLHAIQMELAQRAYMDEAPPWRFDDARAEALRGVLAEILTRIDSLARSGAFSP